MWDIQTLRDAEVAINEHSNRWHSFDTMNLDIHGKRIINAGPSNAPLDYVVRQEIDPLNLRLLEVENSLGITRKPGSDAITSVSTGLKNPLDTSILASEDNKYDIGEAGAANRIRNIYSDITNSEQLEITDASTHTAHWKLVHGDGVGNSLNILDASNEIIAQFRNSALGFSCILHQNLVPDGNNAFDVGASTLLWRELFAKDLSLGKPTATRLQGVLNIANSSDSTEFSLNGFTGGHVKVIGNIIPNADSTYDLGTTVLRFNAIYADNLINNPLSATLLVDADGAYDIGEAGSGERIRWGFADVWNAETLEITDASTHLAHWKITQGDGAGNILNILDASGEMLVQFRNAATGFDCILHQNLIPDGNNIFDIGGSDYLWTTAFIKDLTLGKAAATRLQGILDIANTTDSNIFRLQGISKDSVGAAEVSNSSLSISSSGNFYLRTYIGGDVNCTDIDDGWFGYRRDTNELQICEGGSVLSVTLA